MSEATFCLLPKILQKAMSYFTSVDWVGKFWRGKDTKNFRFFQKKDSITRNKTVSCFRHFIYQKSYVINCHGFVLKHSVILGVPRHPKFTF
jgi:hypothetical protein